jgi:hypothetical protein
MEEMMKTKWSDRVWVGESKHPLSGARTMSVVRSVSSIICRALELLEGGAGDQQVADVQQCVYSVTVKSYCYGHDDRPNSGRARPPEWQCGVGELDDLVIMMAQVQRRLSRGHRWHEVWS